MERKRITDLSATGHPRECAKLILEARKAKKAKYTKQEGHKASIHIIPDKNIVHIDIKEGNTDIMLEIPKNIAIAQAHKILGISPESNL